MAFQRKRILFAFHCKSFAIFNKTEKKAQTSYRQIYVSTRITEHDMRNKISQAVESSKNNTLIRVLVKLAPNIDEEDATSTLYTFRELAQKDLVPTRDVEKITLASRSEDEESEEIEYMMLELKNARSKQEKEGIFGFNPLI